MVFLRLCILETNFSNGNCTFEKSPEAAGQMPFTQTSIVGDKERRGRKGHWKLEQRKAKLWRTNTLQEEADYKPLWV